MTLFIHHFGPNLFGMLALYAVATLVGFTRIYVGAHYPRDVIAGWVARLCLGHFGRADYALLAGAKAVKHPQTDGDKDSQGSALRKKKGTVQTWLLSALQIISIA